MPQAVNPQASLHRPTRSASWSRQAHRLALATLLALGLCGTLVWAQGDAYAEVNRLVRAGQLSDALAKVDQHLSSKPRDPQMRFLKGVIQTESGKSSDAIATFTKLTEDYPELPEPYNNLAVLYAGQSQFDKARAALEMAIRTNPSYATAHENLGDVYAKLASQAYSKALQLDAGNAGVPPKLSLIRSLFAPDTRGARPAAAASAAVAANTAVPSAPAAAPAASKPAAAPVAPAAPAQTTDATAQNDVEAAVTAWAKAWSSRNMSAYLGAYGPTFATPGGQARSAWEAERRSRIEPRSRIGVDISELSVTTNGDKATARFRQAYTSDNLNVTSRKTLDLVRSGNRWLIVRESTGS